MFSSFLPFNPKKKRIPKNSEDWKKNFPELFFLEEDCPKIEAYLKANHFLQPGERVLSSQSSKGSTIDKMVKVQTSNRTVILKQARPWIEAFPLSRAPMSRISREVEFYNMAFNDPFLRSFISQPLLVDKANYLLILPDDTTKDFSEIYSKESFSMHDLAAIVEFLSYLHNRFFNARPILRFENQAMRKYHWRSLFVMPFKLKKNRAFSESEKQLEVLVRHFMSDWKFYAAMKQAGYRYLDQGPTLIHGNFQPGCWFQRKNGPEIRGFESMICGRPEIDLGFLLAHLLLSNLSEHILYVLNHYKPVKGFDRDFAFKIAGAEIFRNIARPLSSSKLPISTLAKKKLLWTSYKMLIEKRDIINQIALSIK